MSPLGEALAKPLRSQLENVIGSARDRSELAARELVTHLGVGAGVAPPYLNDTQRSARVRLRAHGRALGDARNGDASQDTNELVQEIAYQQWHRMLFARFLAENDLLIWQGSTPITIDECSELVRESPDDVEGARTGWEYAGILAARMLPQIFVPDSPVFSAELPPEHQRELENLVAGLPVAIFSSSDGLGWVYQYWQSKEKERVNESEVKIGAKELPAVTQLFTEPYMVDFLLHNSLGSWWVTRHPGAPLPVDLPYLRTLEDGEPAAGRFPGWPDSLADFTLLDPCCGSGHFLVRALELLVPLRVADEGLSVRDAVDLVLRDNLHGLELDARCVEIAVFALALAAWRFPDESGEPLGFREIPNPQVACSGLDAAGTVDEWRALAGDDSSLAWVLEQLATMLAQAPTLGSLLNPRRAVIDDVLPIVFDDVAPHIETALTRRRADLSADEQEVGLAALGLAEAARLLAHDYNLVITNVPYLKRGNQDRQLASFCEAHYPKSKNDLANVFLERCLELAKPDGVGVVQIVMPQNWLFLKTYEAHRRDMLTRTTWNNVALLGPGAFDAIGGEVVKVILLTLTGAPAVATDFSGLDTSSQKSPASKALHLTVDEFRPVAQASQFSNPDSRVSLEAVGVGPPLGDYATGLAGIQTGDAPRFARQFWELDDVRTDRSFRQGTPDKTRHFDGMSEVLLWHGAGDFRGFVSEKLGGQTGAWIRGLGAADHGAVAVGSIGNLPVALFGGHTFDNNTAVILPKDEADLPAIWCFCSSPEFNEAVRRIDKKLNVTNATLVKVPFDIERWRRVAAERYPKGLPKPHSDDPTQWLFHGHPKPSSAPLHVAVARLAGYAWPAESDPEMELNPAAREWIKKTAELSDLADDDGIVCLPSVRGERPAAERLLDLLSTAWEKDEPGSWDQSVLDRFLADAGHAGGTLDSWLRDIFFEQHTKLFRQRPFVWQVWDGRKDGFSALVNYHKLDKAGLDRLIHTYLGGWIRQQELSIADDVGARARLEAAQALRVKLLAIAAGESPYDIFVRWKSLAAQPLGWNPELDDGVRMNIRPFMTAGVLRHSKPPKINIKWDKDRGTDVASAPWFGPDEGQRINDRHTTLTAKRTARGLP